MRGALEEALWSEPPLAKLGWAAGGRAKDDAAHNNSGPSAGELSEILSTNPPYGTQSAKSAKNGLWTTRGRNWAQHAPYASKIKKLEYVEEQNTVFSQKSPPGAETHTNCSETHLILKWYTCCVRLRSLGVR